MNTDKNLNKLLNKVTSHSLLTSVSFNAQTLDPDSYARAVAKTFTDSYLQAVHFADLFAVDLLVAYSYDKDTDNETFYFIVPTHELGRTDNATFKLLNNLLHKGGSSLKEFATIEYHAVSPQR